MKLVVGSRNRYRLKTRPHNGRINSKNIQQVFG